MDFRTACPVSCALRLSPAAVSNEETALPLRSHYAPNNDFVSFLKAYGKNIQTIGSTVKIDGSMRNSRWVRLLADVTGSVNQELLLQNEYLAAENRILRTKLPARLRLSDPERTTLAEIGKRLGPKRSGMSRALPNPTLFWPGIGDCSPRSLMASSTGSTQAARLFHQMLKP